MKKYFVHLIYSNLACKKKLNSFLLILFTICLTSFGGRSQTLLSKKSNDFANPYFATYDSVLSIKLSATSDYDFFEIKGDEFDYDIRPNISTMLKAFINYRHLAVNFGFSPKFLPGNNDNDSQGKTKSFLLGLQLFPKNWFLALQYSKTEGFYLHKTNDFGSDWNEQTDPYIQIPELKVKAVRFNAGYKLNPNFSVRALSTQIDQQLKSCGSFITYLNNDWYIFDNKSDSAAQNSSQKSNDIIIAFSFGYMYTFVLDTKLYASVGFFPGAGIQHTNLITRKSEGQFKSTYTDPLVRLNEKAAIGYNNRKFFVGGEISLLQSFTKQSNTSVHTTTSRTYFQAFAGYRFDWQPFKKKK